MTWTSMLQAYSIHKHTQEAMQLYDEMIAAGIVPNDFTYSIMLGIVADMTNLEEGQRIHTQLEVYISYRIELKGNKTK